MTAAIGSTPSGILRRSDSGIGVDDGERIVGRERKDGEPLAVRSSVSRDRWCTGHEIAERARVGGGGDRVAGGIAVEDLELRDRRVASCIGAGGDESADGGREDAVRDRIDGEGVDTRASVDAGA